MSTYTPFEKEVLSAIDTLTQKVSSLDQKVSSLETEMRSGFTRIDQKVSSLETEMRAGFTRVDETIIDFRDEFRAESANNRVLFHQAFTHISDQLAREDEPSFVPKYPRR